MQPTMRRPPAIKAWLDERPEVEAILPGGRADTQIDGAPVEILGLADHATYRDHWPLLQSTERPGFACAPAMPASSANNWRDV
jgi:putative ABC transport system permease protein